jgi:hypothetical protein
MLVSSPRRDTLLVSRFMWWACRRSALWGMAAGAFLAVLALGGARGHRLVADARVVWEVMQPIASKTTRPQSQRPNCCLPGR